MDLDHEQIPPPILLRPLSEREFVVVTQDEQEGAQVDFIGGALAPSTFCAWTVASTTLSWRMPAADGSRSGPLAMRSAQQHKQVGEIDRHHLAEMVSPEADHPAGSVQKRIP
jgi:hypothetical protein